MPAVVIEITGVITVQQLGEWSVLGRGPGGNWFWSLEDGRLRGWKMPARATGESADLDLGLALSFAVGYAARGDVLLLVERPGDRGGSHLELLQGVGERSVSPEVLAMGSSPLFPHFIPPTEPGYPWKPGWLEGRSLRLDELSVDLPPSLVEIRWLAPSGEDRSWPWSFAGVSCDRVPLAGFIGFHGWEPWEAGEDMLPLAPGYLQDPGEIRFLAAGSLDGERLLVGRRWLDRAMTAVRTNWSQPAFVALPGSENGGMGGVITCPGQAGFFWTSGGGNIYQGDAWLDAVRVLREILPVSGGRQLLPGIPVRLRGTVCPLGEGSHRICHSSGWGVAAPRFAPLSVPPGCPLAGQPLGGGQEPRARASAESSVARIRGALSAALVEVESLRRERDALRRRLKQIERQYPELLPQHDIDG